MANLFELINSATLQEIWDNDTNRAPYMGEAFFPNIRQKGLKFSFIKGKQGVPVALVSANFNTNVLYRDRIGVEKLSASLPFFKEAYSIDEETRQEILSTKEEFLTNIVDNVFDDEVDLLAGADVATERMRMSLLSTGTITIQENGVDKQYDYGFDNAKQFKTEATKWSAEGAKRLASIMAQLKAFKKANPNLKAKYILMNEELFYMLSEDADIANHFASLSVPNPYPSTEEILGYVQQKTGVRILVNDKFYLEARDFNGVEKPFYPSDRYTIIATDTLGQTIYGTTPEEADLLSGQSKASSVAITSNGIAITTWNEVDPVSVNTKVSQVVAPSCPNIDKICIVKVLA